MSTVLTWSALFLASVGLFLSSWIGITAPNMALYPLSVAAPEVSPWLLGLNAIAGLLALAVRPGWQKWLALACGSLGLLISALPLAQLPATVQRSTATLEATLGTDYIQPISPQLQNQWRSQPFSLVDVFRGIPLRPVRVTAAIPFAAPASVPLTLNVYRPLQSGLYPTVVMVHGGAWRSGSPNDHESFNRYLAAQGYTVVAVSYRLAPTYRFPAQLEDVQTALQFIRQHATEYDIDVNRLVIMGRSAGAQLAKLVAYQPDAPPVRAVVSYYGPVNLERGYYDLPNPDPIDAQTVLQDFIGGPPPDFPTQYQQASPWNAVRPNLPPTLLIYGDRDHVVQSKFGRQLAERLRSQQNLALFIAIPWAEHAFDAVFPGVSNQLALYYTERFIAWATRPQP
ncbi:MAG: alpha/beta hydrolase [Leptolyngbyaceae cyanobacterium bins.349]|nr:alpha/beta hydrolase [Leptolyngbyaceae cyanobacterium bins.349]